MCGSIILCGDGQTYRPWWPTEQRWNVAPNYMVVTDCCLRRLPASQTVCRLRCQEYPAGGYGDYQEIESWPSEIYENGKVIGTEHKRINWFTYVSYYDPSWAVECNPEGERSCKQHKRFLRGLHLREGWYEAA